jgi:hypothetical protein
VAIAGLSKQHPAAAAIAGWQMKGDNEVPWENEPLPNRYLLNVCSG